MQIVDGIFGGLGLHLPKRKLLSYALCCWPSSIAERDTAVAVARLEERERADAVSRQVVEKQPSPRSKKVASPVSSLLAVA